MRHGVALCTVQKLDVESILLHCLQANNRRSRYQIRDLWIPRTTFDITVIVVVNRYLALSCSF